MKNLFLVLILLATSFLSYAQSSNENKKTYEFEKNIYDRAIRYSDLSMAKNALYRLIELNPSNKSLLDSLAFLYYQHKQYPSTILVCRDILQTNPKHIAALEMSAVAYEEVQLLDKALTNYETLYLMDNNIYILYKMAFLQYDLKRYKETSTTIDIILNNKESEKEKLFFPKEDGNTQEISMKAAILNLQGLLNKQLKKPEEAKKSFEAALKLHPDFEVAKSNLKDLSK